MSRAKIDIPKHAIAAFCRKHHITRLALFGSVLRDDFGPESDVDVLVEFHPDHVPGLIRMSGMELVLSDLLGCKVDLRTAEDLSRYFRQEIVADSEEQYAV